MERIDYSYRLGDDLSPITGTVRDGTGARVALRDAVVKFHMRNRISQTTKIDSVATSVAGIDATADAPPTGDVLYQPSQTDMNERGTYLGRFVAMFSDGKQMNFPSYEPDDLVIVVW